jgi:hypothetical protein
MEVATDCEDEFGGNILGPREDCRELSRETYGFIAELYIVGLLELCAQILESFK